MMQIDQVCNLIEQYVKQLESLAFSKNAAMVTKLVGAIDCAILIAGVSGDQWSRRVTVAMDLVMRDRTAQKEMVNNLPDAVANAVTLPPVGVQPSANVVPLPKVN